MLYNIRKNKLIKKEYLKFVNEYNYYINLNNMVKEINYIINNSILLEINCNSCINKHMNYNIVLDNKYNLKYIQIKLIS